MSTCRWCTPSGSDTTEFLKSYASKRLSQEDLEGSNDDLCYCLECVVEYHKAREKLPGLHEDLWKLETSRLVAHIDKSIRDDAGEDDELFIVDENGETLLSGYVGPEFENNLRVPLLEILKYPYLLLHEKVSELCVEVLCRMEQSHSSFQVFEKHPGIYLFLVHPNEVIRRWAILTARNLGKVDRDDYYDLQEVLTCLFKVIELGLFESPDIYSSSVLEKGKLVLLPSHLYDTANYKNYWLGICMLLTVLEEQAMDSLLLGPDKQNDFMQSILNTMEKEAADDSTDPFWPALHCFMIILDHLGSKVWGQLIDPVQAFQTIINSVSYNNEIKNIRSSFKRTKSEPESDYNDDMVTCSQIVYNFNTEKPQKDTGWKSAICPDYCPNMYEDMQTLANVLQSDIGRDMRVHHSTFLWFIPFVHSLMDLKDLGVAYIGEVIHYLCSEIKDTLNEKIQQCDKISEFFLLILVSIIELHKNKKCLHLLWISSGKWVEAVVRCAKLPAIAFTQSTEKASGHSVRGSSAVSLQASNSVQHACVQLIRSLLREGYQIGQHALCKQYLDKLNLLLRGNVSLGWQLNVQETQELKMCLKQVMRSIKGKALNTPVPAGNNANSTTLPTVCVKQEKSAHGDECKMSAPGRDYVCSPFPVISKEGQKEQHTVCHLTVQTRGNLSFFINKQVKCVVVGSLVTTHRTFKGLLLLSRSPLAKPIINPSYNDFCPRHLPVTSESAVSAYMNEYNDDQKRAIETAYAMVKQHPGLPKICLIHGPPGTGKSKTIVGLLSRVLRENTRNEKATQKTNSKIKPNRFLVCAPSNAAVDELMKKIIIAFKEKCQNRQEPLGNCGDIKLVRLGAEKAINSEVRGFSLDKQVEHRMKRKPADYDQDIQKKKAALDQQLDMLSRQRAMHRCEKREISQKLDDEIGRLSKERQQLASQLKEVRGHSQKVQADIILESDIICCTLSTSGGGLLESTFWRQGLDPFSCVIVDEAGQSCEVEALIPLIHRCNKLVLVGDPRQLPPTVKSVKAQEYGYDQSLMARLHRHLEEQVQKNVLRSLPVVQLTVQYRMHPDICLFPSNYVYGRTLKTDKATEENRCSSEWPFQPYLIFDVGDGHEERDNDSFSNPQEVKLVMELIRTIKEKRKDLGIRRIGIITPYSAQKKKIQEQLDRVFKNNSPGEVDTVDAFQGREKDCIIVTCVRANSTKGSIGFLASLQRLNVTITRARFSLFILGRLKTLMENKDWNELIQDAQKRGAIIKTSEKNYRKDAVKILKLKPIVPPPVKWQHKLQTKARKVCLVPVSPCEE
nr:PREDICTED: probable helicase senataxin [Phalacrocorax carbo]